VSRFEEIATDILAVTTNMASAGHRAGNWTFGVDGDGNLRFMVLDSDWSVGALAVEHGCSVFRLKTGGSSQIESTDAGALRRTGVHISPLEPGLKTTVALCWF
jgi:hypothetical protein